jgi:hypothetical protein
MEELYSNEIGNFRELETYVYFDGPQLFSCISGTDHHYICYWADSNEDYFKWLYIPVSNRRYEQIRNGDYSIRNAILHTEDNYVWKLLIPLNGERSIASRVEISDLSAEMFPPDNLRVDTIEYAIDDVEKKSQEDRYLNIVGKFSEIKIRSKKVSTEKQLLKIS